MKFQRIGNRNIYIGVAYEHADWLNEWNNVFLVGLGFWEAQIQWPKLLPDREKS